MIVQHTFLANSCLANKCRTSATGHVFDQSKSWTDPQFSNFVKNAVISIFKDIKNIKHKNLNILLSPASASYDQYENFEERGNQFKKIVLKYARKNF